MSNSFHMPDPDGRELSFAQNVFYHSGGLSRYAAESRERHLGSVITAHAVHAAPRRG